MKFRRMSINMDGMDGGFDYRSYALSEISQPQDWNSALVRLKITITCHLLDSPVKCRFFSSFDQKESEAKLVALVVQHIHLEFKDVLEKYSLVDVQSAHTFLNFFIESVNLSFRGGTDLVFCFPEFEGTERQKHLVCILEAKVATPSELNHCQVQGELISARAHAYDPPVGLFAALFNNFEMYIYDHPHDHLMRKFGPYGLAEGLKEVKRRLEAFPKLPADLSHEEKENESAGGDLGGERNPGEGRPGGGSTTHEESDSPGDGEKRESSGQAEGDPRECDDSQQSNEVAGVGDDYVVSDKHMIIFNEIDALCKFPLLQFAW